VHGLQLRQAAQAVSGVRERKAGLAQVLAYHLGKAAVVFNHQQVGAHGRSLVGAVMTPIVRLAGCVVLKRR